ncbi:hypothetical protein ACQ4LE_007463, partial [Meloidogyne hapla]
MSKPEYQGPPEEYYNEKEARKYTSNSRIQQIQIALAKRAYDLLELPDNGHRLLLDIGCGSGLSGEVFEQNGHNWIGVDISRAMLDVAKEKQEEDNQPEMSDFVQLDMGGGLPFQAGVFDGAISISAIQWLCHSNSKKDNPQKRLLQFFESLFACLSRSARAVFQFYPESDLQTKIICQQATRAGFQGGLVIDNPESQKQRKLFLVLSAGVNAAINTKTFNSSEKSKINQPHIEVIGR